MTIEAIKDKGLLLLECISGSKAYGLDTERSDTDIKGVFYLPRDQYYGLEYIPQVSNASNDIVYFELGRFVELLLRNNPNMLELVATPPDSILYRHPLMEELPIGLFLSKLCKDTFAGYALTQVRKARGYKKKFVNPVEKERKSILDFCFMVSGIASVQVQEWLHANGLQQERCGLTSLPHAKGLYALFYDVDGAKGYRGIASSDVANEVSLTSIPKGENPIAHLFFNQEGYSAYCREYREYWDWVDRRNEDRYLGNVEHGKGYDAKNMMHTIRLLQVAEDILASGKLTVRRSNRAELLSIKSGQYQYEDLLSMADSLMERIEAAALISQLPEQPDSLLVEAALVNIRTILYQ
ncbi:DNA polymerase beta superfamily protein [Paraflavitalea pollutisoli]|uniref:DNA polymerase beta superfamily protein n=1 Tax=Paraflavitalea pollutisoli TaxID=3034143 RepID=UPI0023EDEE29|nr:nucleotidyltransferase domain-containing protein [Paraflavitalea sp. H1-2-19X]